MVLFSGVNPVIINFEYVEKRISEKYLSLYSIVVKQYNNILT